MMINFMFRIGGSTLAALACAAVVGAQVTPPAGYIYDTLLLGSSTQSCVAAGPGGTFVAIGQGFKANAVSIVIAKESGEVGLVASGFNSLGDCAYDAENDILYVTDNADNDDFGLSPAAFGAQTGDTVFAIPSASTAPGLIAPGLELLVPDSVPFISSVAVDSLGDVFVADAAGGGSGTVIKIEAGSSSVFASGFDFTAGLAIDPATGNLMVAETTAGFDVQIRQFTPGGTPVLPDPLAGPSGAFGSYDIAFDKDGNIIATGGVDIVSIDPLSPTPVTFISGLTGFTNGVTVDPLTGRVEVLSGFTGTDEEKSLHRFTPIDKLFPGRGSDKTECVHEFYGVETSDEKTVTCVDGAACDSDGAVNDRCTFPVGFCLNVPDSTNFPDCASGNSVTEFSLKVKPFSVGLAEANDRLTAALPISGSTCIFSDGAVVPVKIRGNGSKKDGKGTIKVKTETDAGQKDTDLIKLVCQPAP